MSTPSVTLVAPLRKTTQSFAAHQIPLQCDIYDAPDYPTDSPVFLFFHSGGLAAGARTIVPPWLVQTCRKRKWPLVSASYRLLPQAQGDALLEDAKAAYEFARGLGAGARRKVIVGGASAGFFLAVLIAHHATPKPIALFSITGIPTFRHKFFNSSVLIPMEPITDDDVAHFVTEPVTVGRHAWDSVALFDVNMLLPDGSRNTQFQPDKKPHPECSGDPARGLLYDYYLYENLFLDFVGNVDLGFDWARDKSDPAKLEQWPVTILIQGDDDDDLSPSVASDVAAALGDKVVYCKAEGQGHLFERHRYLEDVLEQSGGGNLAIQQAISALDKVVAEW